MTEEATKAIVAGWIRRFTGPWMNPRSCSGCCSGECRG